MENWWSGKALHFMDMERKHTDQDGLYLFLIFQIDSEPTSNLD